MITYFGVIAFGIYGCYKMYSGDIHGVIVFLLSLIAIVLLDIKEGMK